MIDSHAHLNDPAFADDLDQVLQRAKAAGVELIINVGYDLKSSLDAVQLGEDHQDLWAVVGLHPHDARLWSEKFGRDLEKLAKNPKVLAIGEIGLDYHYDNSPRDQQKEVFRIQFNLARAAGLPVVIHSRDAARDTLEIVQEFPDVPSLLHCYSGSGEMARIYGEMGCYFSFGGPLTFQNARKLRAVAAGIPLERILLETDCPYLTPHPHRGKRNEPAYLGLVAEKLAEIKDCALEKIVDVTVSNTREFFRLSAS